MHAFCFIKYGCFSMNVYAAVSMQFLLMIQIHPFAVSQTNCFLSSSFNLQLISLNSSFFLFSTCIFSFLLLSKIKLFSSKLYTRFKVVSLRARGVWGNVFVGLKDGVGIWRVHSVETQCCKAIPVVTGDWLHECTPNKASVTSCVGCRMSQPLCLQRSSRRAVANIWAR